MKHTYELRKLTDDGSTKTVLEIEAEPKCAKERAKNYALQHPGLYTLKKIDTITIYFTEKELDKND